MKNSHSKQKVSSYTYNGLYSYDFQIIHKELIKYRTITIPNQNITISYRELEERMVETLSSKEIAEIIYLLENAKKRSSSLKPLFQVIAAGLFSKSEN